MTIIALPIMSIYVLMSQINLPSLKLSLIILTFYLSYKYILKIIFKQFLIQGLKYGKV